jgi:hypothetical protein
MRGRAQGMRLLTKRFGFRLPASIQSSQSPGRQCRQPQRDPEAQEQANHDRSQCREPIHLTTSLGSDRSGSTALNQRSKHEQQSEWQQDAKERQRRDHQ